MIHYGLLCLTLFFASKLFANFGDEHGAGCEAWYVVASLTTAASYLAAYMFGRTP